MKLLESVKKLYEESDEMIVVTDNNLEVIWKNNIKLPDVITLSDFKPEFGRTPSLPVKSNKILHYLNGNSVKIKPLLDENKLEGYMLMFYDAEEIETLSDRSSILKYKRNALGNIRLAISPIIAQLESIKNSDYTENLNAFYESVSNNLLKMLSSTVNSNEITKYYSGEFSTELLNVSQCLEETAHICRESFRNTDCEFQTEIEPSIFMNMNYDRLSLAVINLLINGYMYCGEKNKKLLLKAYKDSGQIYIEVSDNGKAADIETMKSALKPFRALPKFKTGETLGLAIAGKFTEHFNGTLYFDKTENGLTVRMSFSDEISEDPQSFRLKRLPPIVGEYEPAYCILAKGLINEDQ